jgi:hypothetical protein
MRAEPYTMQQALAKYPVREDWVKKVAGGAVLHCGTQSGNIDTEHLAKKP